MEAPSHPLQPQRLQALYSYDILDTEREKDFDDIVQLAAEICGTAIAVVNLIDAERQWFKAETGLGVRETPLATSICSHVILQQDFVEINDTLDDPRMRDNPLCNGESGLRFYAGALLTTDDGLPLGTLCVLDYEPKYLTELQRNTLRVLAKQVMAQLEMRKALKMSEILRQEIDHRVKNSLQSVASLARAQARELESEESKSALESMQHRITAIAALHEQLYKTDAGPRIDLGRYVENVCDYLRRLAPEGVSLETQVGSVMVSSQQAAAVGSLVNEFVVNSFKHAFPDQRPGRVEITVDVVPDGYVKIECRDNGVGLPDSPDGTRQGLGMKIAEAACAHLGSELVVETGSQGVTTKLEFDPVNGAA